jgi:hypothetical protein
LKTSVRDLAKRPAVLVSNGGLWCHVGRDASIQMYSETAGDGPSLMTIRSFGATLNPEKGSLLRLYRAKMTPEEPLDDDLFINANFLAKRADTRSRSREHI